MNVSPISSSAGYVSAAPQASRIPAREADATSFASTQMAVQVQALSKTMQVQEDALLNILKALGLAQNLDVEA